MTRDLIKKAYNKKERFLLALDGPSASGKGLIGSMLAKEFSLDYFQSSILYRGLAYICITENIDINNISNIVHIAKNTDICLIVKNQNLNNETIASVASIISVIREVREALGVYLKKIISAHLRLVMEGRDIGTVIAPDADLKLFITADINIRAIRRYKQLLLEGKKCILSDVLSYLKDRDKRDEQRETAPLTKAKDAYLIDTSFLTPNEVMQKIIHIISEHKC